jgi:hypothetical protein
MHWRAISPGGPPRTVAAALALLSFGACGAENRPRVRHLPDTYLLIQKKEYQALYGPTGRLQRVLNDADGDGVAEAIVYYHSDGRPERSELDTDGDHVIDRWETLRPDGTVAILSYSRRGSGTPDAWAYVDEDGFVYRSEFDEDGDGAVDRIEHAER